MYTDFRQFLETAFLAMAAILPIINPLGGAAIYRAKTADLNDADRTSVARRVAQYGFILLLASTLVGAYVLDFFGLSIPIVQVAGGLVVSSLGWSLLSEPEAGPVRDRLTATAVAADDLKARAFYPLTMPLTVGPGSISVAITIGANPAPSARALVVTMMGHVVGLLLVFLIVYFAYSKAEWLLEKLGRTGTAIAMRLSAFILLCIGVQIVWNGVRGLLATL
jgi:multiple antibiotic resistance protein